MTGIEYLHQQIDLKPERFDEFCTLKCHSSTSEILEILSNPKVSFDFVMTVLSYLGIECWMSDEEDDESEQIKSPISCVELQNLLGKEGAKCEEFLLFCEECLVCTGKSKDRMTRKEIYSIYLNWCETKGVTPSSDRALYKWLRESFVELNDETLEIEYQDYRKRRGFKGITLKQIGDD